MARGGAPTGKEIAEQAKQVRFDDSRMVEATRPTDGVHVRFTPSRLSHVKTQDELETGVVVGRAQVQLGEYQGQYRANRSGRYHLFVAKVGDVWKGYAEFNGIVAVEAKEVTVAFGASSDVQQNRPSIEFGSICISGCIDIPYALPPFPTQFCFKTCI